MPALVTLSQTAALVVVDVQEGFDDPSWGSRSNPQAEANVGRLLAAWRRTGRPVIHARHMSASPGSPLHPGKPGNAIKEAARPLPGERVFEKSAHSAFIGTELEPYLRARGIGTVVVTGITTNHCVSTTARMAGDLGFETFVVSDATATFAATGVDGRRYTAEEMQAFGLAEIHREFVTVVDTESLLRRL